MTVGSHALRQPSLKALTSLQQNKNYATPEEIAALLAAAAGGLKDIEPGEVGLRSQAHRMPSSIQVHVVCFDHAGGRLHGANMA